MTFYSILFERASDHAVNETADAPACFADLNLDQVVNAITASRKDYQLPPFFYAPLRNPDAIAYRQDVARDLEHDAVLKAIETFAANMRITRRYLAMLDQLYYHYHQAGWFVEAVVAYCDAVTGLVRDLTGAALRSRGLLAFREYLTQYANSDAFTALLADTRALKTELASVRYCVIIKDNGVKVRQYAEERDYSSAVEETFAKFQQGAVKDYRTKLAIGSGMGHVEAKILEFVAKLHPAIFAHLDRYYEQRRAYLDPTIARFDREIQFYCAYRDYIAGLKRAGLPFCYPQITTTRDMVRVSDGFDIALAAKRSAERAPVVCNDCALRAPERIFIVSGPNQGGKTTFARAFGQAHYLASLGLPVPGREARLFLCDRILTHFEKEEDIQTLRGKLQDELVRMAAILDQATPDSLIILNEIFTSTTLHDAVFLSTQIMERLSRLDAFGVCVTFIDELATLNAKTVSVVSTIVPENPALRTYKIVRKPADGLAYALSIAEKHRLTYACLQERLAT